MSMKPTLSTDFYVTFAISKDHYAHWRVNAVAVRKTRPKLTGRQFAVKMKIAVPENYLDRCQTFVDMTVKQENVMLPQIDLADAGEGES